MFMGTWQDFRLIISLPMKLPPPIIDFILNADAKAFATHSVDTNVIPVSVIQVKQYDEGDEIWLFDFFMDKTAKNLRADNRATLAVWKGLEGYQIKVGVEYLTTDGEFESAKKQMKELFPERVLKGLLILHPIAIYDVFPSCDRAGKRIE